MSQEPPPRCHALVPCAGEGSRSAASLPKQYVSIAGQAMVGHTLRALSRVSALSGVLVVLSPEDAMFEHHVPSHADRAGWVARCGGATRAETVANGLAALVDRGARPGDWVLVHDAARCLIRPAWIERLIEACRHDDVGGLLALPVADTLKCEREGRVESTLERRAKWAAQTPQMFRLGLLQRALRQAGHGFTDEASAVEALGLAPLLVPGSLENFKVTWPEDFALAERLLASAQGTQGEEAPLR